MRFRKNTNKEVLEPAVALHPITNNPLLTSQSPSFASKIKNVFLSLNRNRLIIPVIIVIGVAGVGTYLLVGSHAAPGPIGIAFEANTNNLWAANSGGVNTGAGMMAGTSPSIAAVPGGAEIAFQANTSDLWVTGPLGTVDTHLGMMNGTSPSITYIPGRGYEVAFQANTGNLWLYGQLGTGDQGLGMMNGTNPSIAAVPGGGYAIAFQANTSSLWTVGAFGTKNWGLGMMAGTSPSIAVAVNGTYTVAFQANTGDLWSAGSYGGYDYKLGMYAGSSPSITAIPVSSGSAYEMAFQANTGALWTVGHYGTKNWGLGMYAGSSPSITSFGDGSFNVAFEANTTSLWVLDSTTGAGRDLGLGMHAGTSPSIVVSNMPTPPNDINLGSSLPVGKSIGVGQALYSPDGVFRAVMQPDGNFVVYLNWDELPLWATGTNGSGSNVVNFQTDGNLVVRPSGGAAAWAAGTNTYGATTLNMQDDGNLVLYQAGIRAVWSWMTGKLPPPAAPQPPPPPQNTPYQPETYQTNSPAPGQTPPVVATTSNTDLRSRIVSVAQSQFGVKENPNNSNHLSNNPYGSNNQPWCAYFMSWVWQQAKVRDSHSQSFPTYPASSQIKNWGIANGRWHTLTSGYRPRKGDIVIFGTAGNEVHTAMVAVTNGSKITVYGGNVNNQVTWQVSTHNTYYDLPGNFTVKEDKNDNASIYHIEGFVSPD